MHDSQRKKIIKRSASLIWNLLVLRPISFDMFTGNLTLFSMQPFAVLARYIL